jgi:hypothetical protein
MTNKLAVAGPDSKFKLPDAEPAGFWAGVWHGMILPIAFIASLFNPGVGIYETHNNGGWYNFGFVLGASSSLSGTKVNVGGSDEEKDEIEDEAEDARETIEP